MFHNYEIEKITHTASEAAENLQLYQVVRWKNRTTRYNGFWRAGFIHLEYVDIRSVY